ncbi:ADP-ribosylation factor GTPase-activating protein GCS1 [Cytospora mali]|uniref:ADP-ribosylation factor GTPase-activating protein GCS1 n=1 Tax=Cytospora mali TaxID=578113 RepID=A0A194VWV2_CYTMA|nr:ADP-ribosylation factor GTPase-activating protein GCS1 [Valsa mali]
MASKAMWEVDPETRSKLVAIQKESGNSLCCDCNAPSPQWASPKFGIFICLSCAGVHRGLGVHISFVRSISMDAFKQTEIERMRLGGNENWKKFFEEHEQTKMMGLTWDEATIAERYSGEVGEEWKERLSAKVEGREYVPGERKPAAVKTAASTSRSATPLSGTVNSTSSRPESPATSGGKVKVDDKYFEGLGAANAARPDHLPPSQGGKFAGFGNTPAPAKKDEALPNLDELQKDPLAALGKGFGWFTSTVTKTATTVNKDFIQPTAKQVGESDFAAQAKMFGGRFAQSAQQGVRSAQEGLNKFVEGPESRPGGASRTANVAPLDESKKSFWDDFASLADQRKAQGSSIGTSAMGKGNKGPSGAAGSKKGQDEWDDW